MNPLPRYKNCFVCGKDNPLGLDLTFVGDSQKVTCDVSFGKEYIGYPGMVHGGVVSAVLDEAMSWVCQQATGRFHYTGKLSLKYLKPVQPDCLYQVRASVLKDSKRIFLCAAELCFEEQVCVKAEGHFLPISKQDQESLLQVLDS